MIDPARTIAATIHGMSEPKKITISAQRMVGIASSKTTTGDITTAPSNSKMIENHIKARMDFGFIDPRKEKLPCQEYTHICSIHTDA